MTMTETLFGGMLVVALIFFVARRCGLSHYWSGTLAGGLPFLGYLALVARGNPAGDVLAIHLVVYLATAAILGVFSSARRKRERMHWAPKLIIGFFLLLAVTNAFLLSTATHGLPDRLARWLLPNPEEVRVHTVFPGTVPHDRNKLYEAHQARVEEQRELGWTVAVEGLDGLRSGEPATLTLRVHDRDGRPLAADRALIGFWRMANSKDDQLIELTPGQPGEFHAEVLLRDPGRWVVEVGVSRGEDIYQKQQSMLVDEPAS